MKQVALVRFASCHGFAYEPITFVKRVRFFDSKEKATAYNKAIWNKMGRLMDYPAPGETETPLFAFEMFTKGTDDYQKYAIDRAIIELDRDEIERYIR